MWAEFRKTRAVEALRAQQLGELLLLLVLKRWASRLGAFRMSRREERVGILQSFPHSPISHWCFLLAKSNRKEEGRGFWEM